MFALSKRRFIQLAGLSIANRIVPNRLCGAAKQASAGRKVIIVTFGGGVRYAETFAPEGFRNIPRLLEMKPRGLFFRSCANAGVLSHYNSTASILTGNWQRLSRASASSQPAWQFSRVAVTPSRNDPTSPAMALPIVAATNSIARQIIGSSTQFVQTCP